MQVRKHPMLFILYIGLILVSLRQDVLAKHYTPFTIEWGTANYLKKVSTMINRATKETSTYWVWSSASSGPYLTMVKYKVRPGARYTLYLLYYTGKSDSLKDAPYANAYAFSFDPTIDDKETGGGRIFGGWGQTPYMTKTGWTARRINFQVDPASSGDTLYVLFSSKKPGWRMGSMLKSPADSDADVKGSYFCKYSGRKGFIWGQCLTKPVFFARRSSKDGSSVNATSQSSTVSGSSSEKKPYASIDLGGPTFVKGDQSKRSKAGKDEQLPRRLRRGQTGYKPRHIEYPSEVGTSLAKAGVICYNSAVEGSMSRGDYDTFKFYFPGGKFKCYSLRGINLVADLKDSTGKLISRQNNNDGKFNFRFSQYLPPGFYYLHLRVMRHERSGKYAVVLGNGKKQFREGRIPGEELIKALGGYNKIYSEKGKALPTTFKVGCNRGCKKFLCGGNLVPALASSMFVSLKFGF